MIQEVRRKNYCQCVAKDIKTRVSNCQTNLHTNKNNQQQPPQDWLLICPERDLGPEDILQKDIVPYRPPAGDMTTL